MCNAENITSNNMGLELELSLTGAMTKDHGFTNLDAVVINTFF